MSDALPPIDLEILSDITDKALATAREALLDGREATGVVAYVKDNGWRGTLIYGVPAQPGKRQAAYRLLGRIARVLEVDIAVNVLDTFVNLDTEVEPDEDPRAFEALVAQLITEDGFIDPVIVQRYGRDDQGLLDFQEPVPASFTAYDVAPAEFLHGWSHGQKKPKTLAGYTYELAHNVTDLGVIAPDQDVWTTHLRRLKDKS